MVLQPIPIYRYPQNSTRSSDEVNLMSCIHDVSVAVLSLFSMAISARDQEEPRAPLPLCLSALRNHLTRFTCKSSAFSSVRMIAQGASNQYGCGRPCVLLVSYNMLFCTSYGCVQPRAWDILHSSQNSVGCTHIEIYGPHFLSQK